MTEEIINFAGQGGGSCPFRVRLAGISYCDGTYRIRRKNADIYVFEYVMKGEGVVRTGGTSFTAAAGDVYVLHRGDDHDYASSRHDPWTKMWINADGPLLDSLMQAYRMEGVYHVPGFDGRELFESILRTVREPDVPERIFDRVAILCHELIQRLSGRMSAGDGDCPPEAAALRSLLDRSPESPVDVEAMAAHIYRSPSQTIRLFKKAFGITPYRYLMEKRMDTARLMLRDTHIPVKEIAYRLQFADEHYFSNCFRKWEGVTPTAYRARER